jgi:hypothetical protein
VVKRRTLTIRPIHAEGDGRRENNGSNSGACFSLSTKVRIASGAAHLVEDAAVIRIQAALVEKETLLH